MCRKRFLPQALREIHSFCRTVKRFQQWPWLCTRPGRRRGTSRSASCKYLAYHDTMHSVRNSDVKQRGARRQAITFPRRVRARMMQAPSLESEEGAGKTGCRSHPRSACSKKHAAEPQVRAEHPAFPARWFTGLYVISPGTGVFAPVIRARRTADLISAPGDQDHTISPSASCRSSALLSAATRRVHRVPRSTSVTIAIRPSARGGTCGKMVLICPTRQGRRAATN